MVQESVLTRRKMPRHGQRKASRPLTNPFSLNFAFALDFRIAVCENRMDAMQL